MTREEALKEFVGYQTYDIQPSAEAVKVVVETLRIFTDNATNGEVIQALFPNEGDFETDFDTDWWNAPYKSESDKSADTFEKLLDSGFYEAFRKENNNADCD